MMKRLFLCISLLLLTSLVVSCSTSDDRASKATQFLKTFYTVDSQTIQAENVVLQTHDSKEQANKIESLYSKFKEDMTSAEYSGIIQNRTYYVLINEATKNSCTLSAQSVSLTNQSEDDDTIQYQYKVTIQAAFSNGQPSKTITQSGQIQLSLQKGWKVNYISPADKTLF